MEGLSRWLKGAVARGDFSMLLRSPKSELGPLDPTPCSRQGPRQGRKGRKHQCLQCKRVQDPVQGRGTRRQLRTAALEGRRAQSAGCSEQRGRLGREEPQRGTHG